MKRAAASRLEDPLAKLRHNLERYVREHPLQALGQSAAVGCVLRMLPVRSMLAFGLRWASPLLSLAALWKASARLTAAPGR